MFYYWPNGKSSLHILFLSPKPKWKKNDDVWFTTSLIDHNQLQLIIDGLTYDFPILKIKVLSNKID
jgi:hypothetical protein